MTYDFCCGIPRNPYVRGDFGFEAVIEMPPVRQETYHFPNLRSCREKAGLSKAALAKAAGVDRGTVTRLEDGDPGRKETLIRLTNALNDLHYRRVGAPLDSDKEIASHPSNQKVAMLKAVPSSDTAQ